MKYIAYLLIFVILGITKIANALNEIEFIDLVLNQHHLFLSDEIDMYSQQERLKNKQQNYYGWHLDVTAKYGYEKLNAEKDTNYTYTRNQVEKDKEIALKLSTAFESGISFNAKLSRKLPIDDSDKFKNGEYYKSYNTTEYNNELSANINIPLLKNNTGGINKVYLENAKLDQIIEKLELIESKEDIVEEQLKTFITLAIARKKYQVITNYLASIDGILKKINTLGFDKKDVIILDNKKIKVQRLRKEELAIIQENTINLRKYIKNIDLQNIDFNYKVRTILLKNIKNHLAKNNRDLKISRFDIDKKKYYLNHYTNQKLPDLDLNIWSLNSRDIGNYSSYSRYDKNDFGVSLDFSYPLGGTNSNDYSLLDAKLDYKKKLIDYQKEVDDKSDDIANFNRELTLKSNNIQSFIAEIKNTTSDTELQKYFNKNGNIKFVIDELSDFYELKLEYLDEELAYHTQRIEYDNLLDRLLKDDISCNFCRTNY